VKDSCVKEGKILRNKSIKALILVAILALLASSIAGCGEKESPTATAPPKVPTEIVSETETPEPTPVPPTATPEEEKETSIVIAIPEDPSGFNGLVADTGYEQLLMELVLLGMTDLDPEGNIFLELATELPTLENGGVVMDEDAWTMDVT